MFSGAYIITFKTCSDVLNHLEKLKDHKHSLKLVIPSKNALSIPEVKATLNVFIRISGMKGQLVLIFWSRTRPGISGKNQRPIFNTDMSADTIIFF